MEVTEREALLLGHLVVGLIELLVGLLAKRAVIAASVDRVYGLRRIRRRDQATMMIP
jgi:hypothetical protein